MERITRVELPEKSKITDLIEEEILSLLLKGLNEEERGLVVEEIVDGEVKRVPSREVILESYWTPLCNYMHKFPLGEFHCRNSTQELARCIIKGEIQPGRHQCYLGIEAFSIPFEFQGEIIGVLFGGKYQTEDSNIEERLESFYDQEKGWFDLEEAKSHIPSIRKMSKKEIKKLIERLEEGASQVMKIASNNYTLKKTLAYQGFRSEIMSFFVKQLQVGLPLEVILLRILEEVNYLFEIESSLFLLTYRGKDATISAPPLSVDQRTIKMIISEIKSGFNERDGMYSWKKREDGTKHLTRIRDKFGLKESPNSIYALPLPFGDEIEGFFIFIDPNIEWDDSDFVGFLKVLAETITIQINLWQGTIEREDFMAEMVHRLKSPMQIIMTKCMTLEDKLKGDQEFQRTIQGVKGGVTLLDHQTKGYSFITTKERFPIIKPYQIHVLVRTCINRFRSIAEIKNIGIKLEETGDKRKEVEMDKSMMDLAISNLIDNAIKYSFPSSFIKIKLLFKEESCCISISNKGYEILDEERDKIFERYYRGEVIRRKDLIPGTGIGLAVAKEIVEKIHKGEVKAVSHHLRDGYHHTFSIFLPYHWEVAIL
ncbi:TPA: hypothetical protein DCX15_03960 [bacterium]|nr:hypothetical protein [bacterium]